jgi:hypothetical protein
MRGKEISSGGLALFAAGEAGGVGAAFGLLEERGEDASEGYHETDDEEGETHGAPERGVTGRPRLLRDVGIRDAAGDEREEDERGGEDEEVASHGRLSPILRRGGVVTVWSLR